MSFRGENDDVPQERREPCSTNCGHPAVHRKTFWGKSLCEDCWFSWKKCMDDACDAAGRAVEPAPLFAEWFKTKAGRVAA